jgi:hypothetical protein
MQGCRPVSVRLTLVSCGSAIISRPRNEIAKREGTRLPYQEHYCKFEKGLRQAKQPPPKKKLFDGECRIYEAYWLSRGTLRCRGLLGRATGTVVLAETKIGWGICHRRSRYFIHTSTTNESENTSYMNAQNMYIT